MFPITFNITLNNEILTKRMERKVRKIMKPALQGVLKIWFGKYLQRHFTDAAYGLYPKEYASYKKKKKPMVVSGHLRQHVLHQVPKISGTSHRATIRVGFGRPAKYEGKDLRRKVLALMRWMKMKGMPVSYDAAAGEILKRAGYGKKLADVFRGLIKGMNDTERKEMGEHVKKYIVKHVRRQTRNVVQIKVR